MPAAIRVRVEERFGHAAGGEKRQRFGLLAGVLGRILFCGLVCGGLHAPRAHGEVTHIRQTVEFLAALESRVAGYPGCARAAEFVEREFHRRGVQNVRREEFSVTVPVDKKGQLQLVEENQTFALRCLWPNLVRTSTLPPGGLNAPMIYGGEGEFSAFDGKDVQGRVVLMEFNSWNRWLHAAYLGARAVVFIEPDTLNWRQANEKFLEIPLDLPRFWIGREAGQQLKERLGENQAEVRVQARMDWEQRPAWNILGVIPGSDPVLQADTIAVEAYYDAASVVPALAPGAEGACSIAALLELARYLRDHPPARTIVLLATSAHFQDMLGMVDFLNRHARSYDPDAEKVPQPLDLDLFISLDLSSQTDQLGVWNNTSSFTLKRFFVPFGRWFTQYATEAAQRLGLDPERALVNGISPLKGMTWSSFVPGGIRVDSQVALSAGLVSLAFATVYDGRFQIDSPLDLPRGVHFENLERQISLLNRILSRAFDDPAFLTGLEDFGPVLKDNLRTLEVKARTYPRQSQVPDAPVRGALVAIKGRRAPAKPLKGVRSLRFYETDARGMAEIPGLSAGQYAVSVYVLDPETGVIDIAPDLSQRAANHHRAPNPDGTLSAAVSGARNEKTVVVFPCVSATLFDVVDPGFLTPMTQIRILDKSNVAPRQFGYALGLGTGVIFGAPGTKPENRLKILVGNGMLLLNSRGHASEEEARGQGFLLQEEPLTGVTLIAARDMWNLDEARLRRMRKHAIENRRVVALHQWSGQLIARAEAAAQQRQWDRYVAYAREALGVEARAYPEVVGTLNDVIQGMVFFLALVIPAAFFGERLLIGAPDIRRQLAGVGGVLLVIWLAISQVHPAFEVAHPLVILLSFAIMAMATFVIAIITSRFEGHMKEFQTQTTGVHRMDVSRVGASYSAFMLGISNMRRRKLRTTLTLVTLILLTFTVLSFTSFEAGIRFISVPLQHPGAYEGILVRDLGWNRLSWTALDYIRSHFGHDGIISPRSWFISTGESGEQNRTYIEIAHQERTVKITGLMGLTPAERQITGLDRALTAGSFFARTDEATCLMTDAMAANLGIDPDKMGRARIHLLGKELVVRGIVDAEKLFRIRDLDDEPLTPVDFALSMSGTLGTEVSAAPRSEEATSEVRAFTHLQPENVLVMPFGTLREMGGDLHSVAVRFEDGKTGRKLMEDYLVRLVATLFAGFAKPGSDEIAVSSYTSIGTTSIKGLSALLVPMFIAALIVLNTMLGAVYERFREIGIYSSVGLAPSHIALLFIAEACVYAVLGITLGYLLGQGVGKALMHAGLLGAMNLNYSSMAAVLSSLLVMVVVLLSTLYPAWMASKAAVPDVVRRWQPPPPRGKRWEFQFPFMISGAEIAGLYGFLFDYFKAYSEESVGEFYTRETRLLHFSAEHGRAYAIEMNIWLAPLELGVSQHLRLSAVPEAEHNVYSLFFEIDWISGENEAWKRVNKRFFKVLRKEFLIWYSLKEETRVQYREKTEGMLEVAAGAPLRADGE